MPNIVYIETSTRDEEYSTTHKLVLPLESFITYSVYKGCAPKYIDIQFVTVEKSIEDGVTLDLEENLSCTRKEAVPWTVAMCVFPVIQFGDTLITGLCAVARHLSHHRSAPRSAAEHSEGFLGFRKSCLQAPNEVSIWTKFCEIDLLKTVKSLLHMDILDEVPVNLVRFENHLNKPVRMHNVYKLVRDVKRENHKVESDKLSNGPSEEQVAQEDIDKNRMCKPRKWKSNKKKLAIDSSVAVDSDDVSHKFAEGPFLTLADLILLPQYHILIKRIGETTIQSLLPLTNKWFKSIITIPELDSVVRLANQILIKPIRLGKVDVPTTDNLSLYKCDPKRHNPKKRLFTKEVDVENALNQIKTAMELDILPNDLNFGAIKWNDIPAGANPTAGHLPNERTARKTQQLENLTLAVLSIAKSGDVIVDFCCGSGHLGILIAYLLPECTIILLENKEQSLLRARKRVHDMGLTNIYFYQCNLDFFIGRFDVGIGLHACGVATDLVLDKCLESNAKFVLCPCCYGALHATDRLAYPRSRAFAGVSQDQYLCLGHAADQTHSEHPLRARGDRCMAVVDSDRALLAKESGYEVSLRRLRPLTCTPKNNLLIGCPGALPCVSRLSVK